MKRVIFLSLLLLAGLCSAVIIHFNRLPGGPPIRFEILVINDGEPPVEITDFHFSVSAPCMITAASPPPGWRLRYALPNNFVEMDADPGAAIIPGGEGMFGVSIDGPCSDASYSFYLTGPSGVIPGTGREGPIEGLSLREIGLPTAKIIRVFPNPFNSAIRIVIDCWSESQTHKGRFLPMIEVTDICGRVVARLSGFYNAGEYEFYWRPGEFAVSGLYFIRIKSIGDDFTGFYKKIIYLK